MRKPIMRFTDDEILSMAVDADVPVPVLLVSVDLDDEDAVVAAALRGQRSLSVRGLIAPDRVDPVVLRVQEAMGARTRFTTFAGSRNLDRAIALPATTWFPVAGGLVRLEEGAMGTFTVLEDTIDQATHEITTWFDVARDAVPNDASGGAPELWVCLAAVTAAGVNGIAARTGELCATMIDAGAEPATESRSYADAYDLIGSVLARAVPAKV
jgi:hypothetical protein